jgi:hypothetical protein
MEDLDKLRALEREIEREWWWLNGALHAIAQASSGDGARFREMQAEKLIVDRKRVEIASRIAALVGPKSQPEISTDR